MVVSLVEYILPAETGLRRTVTQTLTTVLVEEVHRPVVVIQHVETVFRKIVIPKLKIVLEERLHPRAVIVTSMTVLFVMVSHLLDCLVLNFLVSLREANYLTSHV